MQKHGQAKFLLRSRKCLHCGNMEKSQAKQILLFLVVPWSYFGARAG
jgi:hypothetical protein